MGIIQRSADLFYTFRFIKLLVTRWENTDAFKLGIIDKNGKPLKKVSELNTSEEKSAYTLFHRLTYNIKRIVNKVPLVGRTTLASFAAALWLIKEETGMSDSSIKVMLEKYCKDNNINLDTNLLKENNEWLTESSGEILREGQYKLLNDIASPKTGEIVAKKGTFVYARHNTKCEGFILGTRVYNVDHVSSKQKVFVTLEDLSK